MPSWRLVMAFAYCVVMFAKGSKDVIKHVTYSTDNIGKTCAYFTSDLKEPLRVSGPEEGLVNCTWYAASSCCKRTEVTSVFSGMMPLHDGTKECRNRLNYMMCYFCDPRQHIWFRSKAYVCSSFCNSVYTNCGDASYNGKKLGAVYKSGDDFCQAMNFEVVKGNSVDCFDFDPTVFASSSQTLFNHALVVCATLIGILLKRSAAS